MKHFQYTKISKAIWKKAVTLNRKVNNVFLTIVYSVQSNLDLYYILKKHNILSIVV